MENQAIAERMNINLNWFCDSGYFQSYEESYFSNLPLSNPDLFDECMKCAESGSDGRTHSDVIDLWREAWEDFCKDKNLDDTIRLRMIKEIDDCENWHEKNGSLFKQLG